MESLSEGAAVINPGDVNAGTEKKRCCVLFGELAGTDSRLVDSVQVVHPDPTGDESPLPGFAASETKGACFDWIGDSRDGTITAAAINHTFRDGRTPSGHFRSR